MSQDAQGFNAPITEDDIANYLVNTPDFFERHAEVLAAVSLTSPHSHRTISLQERQAEIMRGKIRDLELAQSHMVRFGQANVAIADKLNDWTLALLTAADTEAVVRVLTAGLAQAYDFGEVQLRLQGADGAWPAEVAVGADSACAQAWASAPAVQCGPLETGAWRDTLRAPEAAASHAALVLHAADGQPAGVLLLVSDDAQRLTPDMGSLFLQRVAALATAALRRLGF
jgi:uncharacterized protein YigA (DUF484 family)